MNKYKERVCDECNEIKEKEAEFIRESNLGFTKYIKLRDLLNNPPKISTKFTQELMKIVRGTKLNENSSEIIKILRKKRKGEESPPIPKGSKIKNKKEKSNSFITFQERKSYLKILMDNRGLGYDEAKERLDNLIEYEREIRKKFKEKGKEEEIKQKQQELLEELWNF